jgi:aminopeptidase N
MADLAPGVTITLATERARTIHDIHYDLRFEIPSAASEPIDGRVTIRFRVTTGGQPVVLDFAPGAAALKTVTVGGKSSHFHVVNNHLVLPGEEIGAGENRVDIVFQAGDAALNRNPDFLYTLFVPARAHLTFPCFDQPDLKGRYTLELTVPADWQAVGNGAEGERETSNRRTHIRYLETEPISSYLFAFAAGKFQVETAERAGRAFHMFHRETDAAKVVRNREAMFDLHAAALAWLERYTGIPYQFGKFDFVLIPSFQFSGMEHPGAILYNASSMLLDESATENQLLNRASTISHETAHMWFGDLVTMRWFDDVWMKEVFANFMAGKIVNPSFPAINHDLRFLVSNYPSAYSVDRTEGTHPIRQQLDNLSDAGSQYGPIIYQKAPIVMRQLERLIGEDAMRDGLRDYLRQFRFANATWLDLVAVLGDRTERDLVAWSKAWVEQAGRPTVQTHLTLGSNGRVESLEFSQSDARRDRQLQWTEKLEVLVSAAGGLKSLPIELSDERIGVAAARGLSNVAFVLPTGGGLGYGNFVLDADSRRELLRRLADLTDPLARGAAWVTLWEEMLDRRLAAPVFVDAVLQALPREDVQQNASLLVGYLREAYWRFLPAAVRERLAPTIEKILRDAIARATTPSARATYFNGFRSMVATPAGVAFLERVWARQEKIPGLTLAEPDEASMALDLAVRGVPNATAILEEQRARFTNPDRQARFEFVMPALAASADTREQFFASLADVKNRRREPWVIEGLSYLNHPLRAAASTRYVLPALERLQEIQSTGDIFFPKNWMDASLTGYNTPQVAATIRSFLNERPDYPLRLRRIILQAADDVFRAATILRESH